jgi:serine/threonine protein kinase
MVVHDKKEDTAQQRKKYFTTKASSTSSSSTSKLISFGASVSVDFALKSIILEKCLNKTYQDELLHEIAMLRKLDHPNIVRALETYDYKGSIYLVLELCNGGDLYTRDPYTERQACSITYTLLDAVAYLHSKNITHRDLKYENLMFASPSSSTVKIIDFGLSKKYGRADDDLYRTKTATTTSMNDKVGTIYTMAPEVIKGNGYDEKCDCWSVGVIAFMLLSSSLPFFGQNAAEISEKILNGQWKMRGRKTWSNKSVVCKDFLRRMLVQDATARPSATQAMDDAWFANFKGKHLHIDDGDGPISVTLMDRVQATIQTFADYSHLKKLALLVLAHQSIDEEIGDLRRLFLQRFDTDKASANVSFPEFKDALVEYYEYTDEELVKMFTGMDIDGTGKISFTEFLAASIEAHGMIEEVRIAEAFDRIDCDDSGYITVDNLKDILGDEVADDFLNEIIDEVKTDMVDNHISYQDFLGLWDSDCDDKLEAALLDVQQRRRKLVDSTTVVTPVASDAVNPASSTNNDSFADSDPSVDDDADAGDTASSQSLFNREKAKSVRDYLDSNS